MGDHVEFIEYDFRVNSVDADSQITYMLEVDALVNDNQDLVSKNEWRCLPKPWKNVFQTRFIQLNILTQLPQLNILVPMIIYQEKRAR